MISVVVGLTMILNQNKEFLYKNNFIKPYIQEAKPHVEVVNKEIVKTEIERQATESRINVQDALRIAKCESEYDWLANNKKSSAKGVYQFLSSTWKRNCEGDVFNYKDNIRCFIKLYKNHPNYWVCK
jgi:hypothetical protein